MIGVVVSDIENPHFTQMVRAAEDAAYKKGYRLLLCNTDEDPAKQRAYLGVLAAERVAGAIISPTEADADEISELIDLGTSVVSFDRAVADRRADAILPANLEGSSAGDRPPPERRASKGRFHSWPGRHPDGRGTSPRV